MARALPQNLKVQHVIPIGITRGLIEIQSFVSPAVVPILVPILTLSTSPADRLMGSDMEFLSGRRGNRTPDPVRVMHVL